MNRCVNLDWLEVYCLEPQYADGRCMIDADYLRKIGWVVTHRDFGTPLYNEVLFLAPSDRPDFIVYEVRRDVRLTDSGNCFINIASCHIRVTNQMLYTAYPIVGLCKFLTETGYYFKSIKRIDIALDFNFFDDGENPAHIIDAYMSGKISKLNQSNISAHGLDSWSGRRWNSLKWGSPSSNVSTKLYNKSMEMMQTKMKSYIQDSWIDAGLRLDVPIWRVEFSIKSGIKGFKNKQSQDFTEMKLSQFDSRSKLLFIFHTLALRYFNFRVREYNEDGTDKRKDRCRKKNLFSISLLESIYEPTTFKANKDPTRIDKILLKRCLQWQDRSDIDEATKDSAMVVVEFLEKRLQGYIH